MTHLVDRGPSIPPSSLQSRLRDSREWRGLEQADLARELGVGRSTVSNYERGVTEPGKLVINAWAVVCNIDVEWLKTGTVASPSGGGTTIHGVGTGIHRPLTGPKSSPHHYKAMPSREVAVGPWIGSRVS